MDKEREWQDKSAILEQGLRSPFWKMLEDRGRELLRIAEVEVRNPDVKNRDFSAGKLVGLEEILKYPENYLRNLKLLIKNREQKPQD